MEKRGIRVAHIRFLSLDLIFKFYFSFETALLYIIELEFHSSPAKLVGKVCIISNIQGIISKETRPDRVGSGLVTEPRCHFSDSKDSAFPTRSQNLILDCSEGLGLGFKIRIFVTLQETDCDGGVYCTVL